MTRRQLPRWTDLAPLVQLRRPGLDPTARRLAGVADVADLRAIARRRTPRAVFDYVDGGAEAEISLRRSRQAFARAEFRPSVLRDVSTLEPSTRILGTPSALPIALAPTGFTRMVHHAGEPAVGRVAERAGLVYTLSTMGTTGVEALAQAAPLGRRWFQLYLWRDRDASKDLVQRAAAAGYEALVLTVDTPVAGARLRDVRGGLTIPPSLTVRTLADMALHPAWWINLLTTEPLEFATLNSFPGTAADLVAKLFDPSATLEEVRWLRDAWAGHLVVKGIQTVDDARAVVDAGADAVQVSNHGGRQLDRAPTPLEVLPEIVRAVGDRAEVYLDGGVLRGSDALVALALGARAVFVGRAYLYALMAGGEQGVQRLVDLLDADVRRTMALLGVTSVEELTPDRVRLR